MKSNPFIKVRIDETALVLFSHLLVDAPDMIAWMLDMVEDGYKISLSSKPDQGSFAAYMTGKKGSPVEKKTIGNWGPDVESCLQGLWLIHEQFSPDGDWNYAQDEITAVTKQVVAQMMELRK